MNKQEFLEKLKEGLAGLPQPDVDERVSFYGEMIDDKVEDGLSEQEAISEIGTVESVISGVLSDIPLGALVKKKIKTKRKLYAWEIVLIILGAPVWLPLLIAAAAVIFSLYVSLWAVIVSLWAASFAVGVTGIALIIPAALHIGRQNALSAVALIGMALCAVGVSLFMIFGCAMASKGVLLLTKKVTVGIKKTLVRKEKSDEKVD